VAAHLRATSEGHPTLRSRRRGLIEPPIVSLFRPVGAERNCLIPAFCAVIAMAAQKAGYYAAVAC
jgi:hypothetical protein